jgi:hypothetical protein
MLEALTMIHRERGSKELKFNIIGFGSSLKSLFKRTVNPTTKNLSRAKTHSRRMNADMGGEKLLYSESTSAHIEINLFVCLLVYVYAHDSIMHSCVLLLIAICECLHLGTNLLPALTAVFSSDLEAGWVRSVFVMTDGGISNTSAVLDLIRSSAGTCRVFTFGLGAGVSESLVLGAAKAGNGTAVFIQDDTSPTALSNAVRTQLEHALQPAFTNVSLRFFVHRHDDGPKSKRIRRQEDSTKMEEALEALVVPRVLPPVFHRDQYTVFAWVRVPDGHNELEEHSWFENVSAVLSAQTPKGETTEQHITLTVYEGTLSTSMRRERPRKRRQATSSSSASSSALVEEEAEADKDSTKGFLVLSRLAARETIRELEAPGMLGGQALIADFEKRKKEIVRLGKAYSLATLYTSFVAVEERVTPVTAPMQSVQVPTALPRDMREVSSGGGSAVVCTGRSTPLYERMYARTLCVHADARVTLEQQLDQ